MPRVTASRRAAMNARVNASSKVTTRRSVWNDGNKLSREISRADRMKMAREYIRRRNSTLRTESAMTRWDAMNGIVSDNGFTNRDYSGDNMYMTAGSTGQTMDRVTRVKMRNFYYRQNRKAQGLSAG